jgi:iron complex outermembrane receptor protein
MKCKAACGAAALAALVLTLPLASQETASRREAAGTPTGGLAGRVVSGTGTAAFDAAVRILELDRLVAVDREGRFSVGGLEPGVYYLDVSSPRYGQAIEVVEVVAGRSVEVEIVVDVQVHTDEIVVTTSGDPRHASQLYQPVGVLSGDDLVEQLEMSLGDTLAKQAGVSSSYFGPGAGRPIIRGLSGDRVRVLSDGIGSGDASATSPDHAVSIDPLSAERIEIARGPATLLYGSSAIGGAVNILSNAVPESMPSAPVTGDLSLRGGTVADELSGSLKLDGGAAKHLAWHLEGFARDTGDYDIPDDAVLGGEEEGEEHAGETPGVLENSSIEAEGGSLGLSWVGERSFFGVAASGYDTNYGIPGAGHHHEEGAGGEEEQQEEAEEGEAVRIDLQQRRVDLKGGWSELGGFVESLRLRLGSTDYEHTELEGTTVGTVFTNEALEGRFEAIQRRVGKWHGSFGLQYGDRDFAAIGEEAFTPPSETEKWALFAFEELDNDDWRFQIGGRFESQEVSAVGNPARSDDALSASAGAIYAPAETLSLAINLAHSAKLPNAEELYSNGPHIATDTFETGDPDLETETSLGVDLRLHLDFDTWGAEVSAFYNDFSDYIYLMLTGEEEDGLRVGRYVQSDAELAGLEAELHLELLELDPHHLELDLMGDLVRGELADGDNIPRLPAARLGAALRYRSERWSASAHVTHGFEQDRVSAAEGETPTPSSTLVGASVGYRFFTTGTVHRIELIGTNLTDEVARVATSYLKDEIVLPGRNLTLAYRLSF